MKKILWIFACALLMSNVFLSTGCAEDDTTDPTPTKLDPLLIITSASDVSDGGVDDVFISDVGILSIQLEGTKGTDPLKAITFRENGTKIDISRLEVAGETIGDAAILLSGTPNAEGFTWDVNITLDAVLGSYDYTVDLEDDGGLTDNVSFTINIIEDPVVTTPIDTTLTGVLFNAESGNAGTGSLDLDEGKGSGISTDGEVPRDQTEIRDMGLDCTIPAPGFNWRRQIGGWNGTELRQVDLTQVENFTFDNVTTKEEIQNAFDTGIALGSDDVFDCATGDAKATVDYVSGVLAVDDLLVAFNGTTYYLIKVDDINEDGMTNDDDFYTFSIKH